MLRMPVSTRAAITHRRRQTCYDAPEDSINAQERAAAQFVADATRQEREEGRSDAAAGAYAPTRAAA